MKSDEAEDARKERVRMERVFFTNLRKKGAKWPPVETEWVWSTPLGADRFRVEEVPLFVRGVALGDIVEASEKRGSLIARDVVSRSGHSTFRVLFGAGLSAERASEIMLSLGEAGAAYENARANLWTVDVADLENIARVQAKVGEFLASDELDFEEGYLAGSSHPAGGRKYVSKEKLAESQRQMSSDRSKVTRTNVYLTLWGLEPSEVTERLRIAPQRTKLAGTFLRSGLVARHAWEIFEKSEDDLPVVMTRLLDRLRPRWDELTALVAAAEDVEIEVAIYQAKRERRETISLVLEPDVVVALGALRPYIQFSIY